MRDLLQQLLRQAAKEAEVPEDDVQFRYGLDGLWTCVIRIYKKKGGYVTEADGSNEDPALAVTDALESVCIYREIFAEKKNKRKAPFVKIKRSDRL